MRYLVTGGAGFIGSNTVDELVRRASVQSLQLAGFDATGFANAESALPLVDADFAGVVVSDIRLPGMSGLDLLAQCHERARDVPIILVTGHGDISMAVQAMRATLRQGLADAVRDQMAHELAEQIVQRATADFAEGVRAVAERRAGRFTGR